MENQLVEVFDNTLHILVSQSWTSSRSEVGPDQKLTWYKIGILEHVESSAIFERNRSISVGSPGNGPVRVL
jgi:hypothetical protein